jgi:hypothetical protein
MAEAGLQPITVHDLGFVNLNEAPITEKELCNIDYIEEWKKTHKINH